MKTGNPTPPIPLVAFCVGPERWLKARAIEILKEQCLAAGFEDMDFVRFDEPCTQPEEVLAALRTAPFGSPRRLVLVEGLEEAREDLFHWLPGYTKHPNAAACLVLCAEKLKKGRALFPAHQRSGAVQIVLCKPMKGTSLQAWVTDQAKEAGKKMSPQVVALLVSRVGSDLNRLSMALTSLVLFSGSRNVLEKSDVEALIAPSVRETAFDILDLAAAGQPEEAVGLLRQALASGQLTIEQWMGAFGWMVRMAWKAKHGFSGTPTWASPDRQMALSKLSRWPASRLSEVLHEALLADEALKRSHPLPELLADELLLRLGRP